MSNLGQVQKDIYTFIDANLGDTPIAWPNYGFIAPTDEPWLSVAIAWGDGVAVTMAPTNRNTITGVLFINCYCVEDEGQGDMLLLADQVRDLFNREEISGIRFDVPSAPKSVNGMFNQVSVNIPFTVDETV